ncbi:MAG: Fic family protein [Nitrososphaerota archaeon]|nr:Fic family protein [Nitrososphaerota archaeon]MDG6929657.1 Fic family protein [Nitrososphaerota archaeon]
MIYPTVNFVKRLHEYIIDTTGGETGILDSGLLESAVERSRTVIHGYEPFKDTITKAVATGYAIISWHPFVDGNKRTGIETIRDVLWVNGIYMALPPYIVKYSIQAAVPETAKIHINEEQFVKRIMSLSSTSGISRWWKRLRYEYIPYSRLIGYLELFKRWPQSKNISETLFRTMLDWFAAGDAKILKETFEEWSKWSGRTIQKEWKPEKGDFIIES